MTANNELKKKILSLLIADSRRSFRTIAKELNISTTTVSRIVKELENTGIIVGYCALVDWQKIGYDSTLCLQITVASDANVDSVGSSVKNISAVKQVFYTTGDATFSAYAVCKNTNDAAELLEELRNISGVERVVPHTVLKTF